jgi:hypothetical protein
MSSGAWISRTAQGREGLRGLHLIRIYDRASTKYRMYLDVLSGRLVSDGLFTRAITIALVVGGVGLIECAESAAFLLVRQVAVGVGCGGSDNRNVNVDRRVEQVVVAVDLHELDEVVCDGVHLGAFQPRVGVRA